MRIEELISKIYIGMEIKKVRASSKILSIDKEGIKYSLGTNGNSKKVSFQELEAAIKEIQERGFISREWYETSFPQQSKSAPCNYSVIGGLCMHLAYVKYEKGRYIIR